MYPQVELSLLYKAQKALIRTYNSKAIFATLAQSMDGRWSNTSPQLVQKVQAYQVYSCLLLGKHPFMV
jgi:hypothetical protein